MTLQQIALEPLHHDKRKRLLVVDLALDTDIDTAKRTKPLQLPVSSSTILINEPETDTVGHVQGLDITTNVTCEQTLALTEARTKARNQQDKGKKPAEECENPFRPEQLQQLQQLELKMMAELYSKQLDVQKLNETFSFLLRQREEEMKRLVGYLEKAPESTAEKTGQGAEHDHGSSPAHRSTEPGHSVPPSGHAETERNTPAGTMGTTESTPSAGASSCGANITPSGEGSSRGANITPSGEGSSRGADVTPSGRGTSPEAVTDVPGQVVEYGKEPVETPLTPIQLEIAKGLEILMRFRSFGNVSPMQVCFGLNILIRVCSVSATTYI
ncbi:hypothetical protein R1sor_009120 [Riccia sorocarpa]|uniref:Uncharacterized protein n=1 Tax=Riccia sorocarpa TaxID=122646 RepID=A0ABD3H8V8_9MARC